MASAPAFPLGDRVRLVAQRMKTGDRLCAGCAHTLLMVASGLGVPRMRAASGNVSFTAGERSSPQPS